MTGMTQDDATPVAEMQRPRNAHGQFLPRHDPQVAHDVAATAIQAYVAGQSVQDIAARYGVDRGIVYDWMLAELGPEQYRDLITRALVARVRRADEALEAAEEPHHIARARELARFARMDLERRRPALYGQQTRLMLEAAPDLGDRLRRAMERERLIEGEGEKPS